MPELDGSTAQGLAAFEKAVSHLVPVGSREDAIEWAERRRELYEATGELPVADEEARRLRELKGAYAGNRIFVIGNGPSLTRMDLSPLANEYTFAVNRFYLMYDRIDWVPTFYTALDWRVVPDNFLEINGLSGSISFYDKRYQGLLVNKPNVYWYAHHVSDADARKIGYSFDISRGVHGAGSVVGSAIQIAHFLGFDPIYLIGCDLGYVVPETVTQEGEDRFGSGVKLLLTSTKDDDVNHFDPRYFGTGRRWHDPNVPRMIDGHIQCYRAIAGAGGRIYNATTGGQLEVYPRVAFESLFTSDATATGERSREREGVTADGEPGRSPAELEGAPRQAHIHVDETAVVASLLESRRGPEHVMVDVGAHVGTASAHFNRLDWTIYCFEPDPTNRAKLISTYGNQRNVTIDARAVSDAAATGVALFSSQESSGVSGLNAFLPSHRETARVDVTTISAVVDEHQLKRIDFLKIDVEGLDLFVLKGVPWDRVKPDVIECEFEDTKTVPLGHTLRDTAEYLRDRGYSVYVSEWHPIVRYGVRHDWRRVVRYGDADIPGDAWGNLLGFTVDPGLPEIRRAFEKLRTSGRERVPVAASPSAALPSSAPSGGSSRPAPGRPAMAGSPGGGTQPVQAHRPLYAPFGDWLKPRSPSLYRVLQLGRRTLVDLWRRRAWTVPAVGLIIALALVGILPVFAQFSALLLGGAALATALIVALYIVLRIYESLDVLSAATTALRSGNAVTTRRAAEQERAIADLRRLTTSLSEEKEKLERRLQEQSVQVEQALREDIHRLEAATKADDAVLKKEVQQAADASKAVLEQVERYEVFQIFNRDLKPEHVQILLDMWRKRLDLPLTRTALAYLAHRIRTIERNCTGRLAAPIEDAVLRTLVAVGVRGKTLDVLEIGTLFGIGAAMIYDYARDRYESVHLTVIDPLDGYYGNARDAQLQVPVTVDVFWRNMAIAHVPRSDVVLVQAFSYDDAAISKVRDHEYDVLVIDADHTYAGVKSDFDNYHRLVRRGGFIIFDDYGAAEWPDVERFVDGEVLGRPDLAFVGAEWRTAVFRVVSTESRT